MNERDKLDEAARTLALTTESVGREMAWSDYEDSRDAFGDARELKGHVDTCILRDWSALPQGKRELTQSEVEDLLPKCGQGGWYCERVPIKEQPGS